MDPNETEAKGETTGRPRRRTQSLKKYGVVVEPPKDDAVFYVTDDTYGFLAQGRDFEPAYVNHKYTEKERETLATFESLDYLPSHSEAFKYWTKRQKSSRFDMDRWVMMGLIGFSVGLIGFLLHQLIEKVADIKWEMTEDFIQEGRLVVAWIWSLGYTLLFVMAGTASVVLLRPSAGGSGIPEVIGFLNGTVIRHIFNVKTMVIKFLSCVCAVGSGMPVGPEGPMIHLGSLVGAGLSQFRSDTLKIKLPFFERFRNPEDRRNFVSAGAAAGVASAFGAPVGGLLFSMEEVSSFWNIKLSWQIFFACMVSTFTTDLFNSAFSGFRYTGNFGQFKKERYILFSISEGIDVNILMFLPTFVIGIVGGILGALFTFLNLKFARVRKRLLATVQRVWVQKLARMVEPVIVMVLVTTVSVFLPAAFSCSRFTCIQGVTGNISTDCLNDTRNPLHVEESVYYFSCPKGLKRQISETTWKTNGSYNELATLLFGTSEEAVKHLFSRNTHLEFGYASLFTVLPFYFLMVCWASGTSVSCGILVPMLYIGALYGRIIGQVLVTLFSVHSEDSGYWAWMDPGAFALIGAASFFGGVSRLTLAVTVIMMELTNDVQFLLPIMVSVMVSKWVGDFFTHPLYHALLELKCIPFLDQDPTNIVINKKQTVSLELFTARDVMASPVCTVTPVEKVATLAHYLMTTNHGGFPVIQHTRQGDEVFYGLITRLEVTVLLMNEDLFIPEPSGDLDLHSRDITDIDYHQLTIDKLSDPDRVSAALEKYSQDEEYQNLYINLKPYINQSALCVPEKFSLHRTYIIFRSLGLRHLTVVNDHNHVLGIITRKDLMGYNIEEKLTSVMGSRLNYTGAERSEVELESPTADRPMAAVL
ncbi:chloride channel protein C-like [Liolophura sinensis]|uniref:chloride channel protein C-like n=1 Tax=Liolophura sinensis TaxID=3198878 RepID=UPI0031581B90